MLLNILIQKNMLDILRQMLAMIVNQMMIFLKSKGYIPLIWKNKRNSSEEDFKKRKIKKQHVKHYKKRHIIENSYSWLETKIPRLSKIYDKYVGNYINMVYMAIIDIIICRECV